MPKNFDYTTQVRRFALRHPVLNHIAIQVNFWSIAFLLLSFIIHFTILSIKDSYSLQIPVSFLSSVLISIFLGLVYGTTLGLVDIFIEKGFFQRWPLGAIILLRGGIYYVILIVVLSIVRYVIWAEVVHTVPIAGDIARSACPNKTSVKNYRKNC